MHVKWNFILILALASNSLSVSLSIWKSKVSFKTAFAGSYSARLQTVPNEAMYSGGRCVSMPMHGHAILEPCAILTGLAQFRTEHQFYPLVWSGLVHTWTHSMLLSKCFLSGLRGVAQLLLFVLYLDCVFVRLCISSARLTSK